MTDPALDSVQVFDSAGNCQAMVPVAGVVCACATTKNTLLAACADKVTLVRFDGSEKTSMALESREVRSVTRFKSNPALAVLAQKRKVSVLDCGYQKLSVVKFFNSASSRRKFNNVTDVAMTNKDVRIFSRFHFIAIGINTIVSLK